MRCGMHMTNPEDFGGGTLQIFTACTVPTLTVLLKSYDEVLKGMVSFMMAPQNMDRETAEGAAREHMVKMAAWSGH